LGIGDWGWGIGDWGLGPIPNPQSPIPNPQSPIKYLHQNKFSVYLINYLYLKNPINIIIILKWMKKKVKKLIVA